MGERLEAVSQTRTAKFVDRIKKHWIVVFIAAILGFLIFADDAVQAGKHLWEIVRPATAPAPKPQAVKDKFALSGVKMAFVLSYLSNEKLKVEGETVVPVFDRTQTTTP